MMQSRLSKEKNAESVLGLCDKFWVIAAVYPFTYFLKYNNHSASELLIVQCAPFVLVIGGMVLRVIVLNALDKISD